MPSGMLYCLNLTLSMPFRFGSRTPVIFKTKLSVTSYYYFCHKELHLKCLRLELNIVTWSTKVLKGIRLHHHPTPMIECSVEKIWKTHSPRCPNNTFLEVFHIKLWYCYKFICNKFSKATKPFDFIKPNVIRKSAYNVKYISQINSTLIMFFRKFEKIFLN